MSCNEGNFFIGEGGKSLEQVAQGGWKIFQLGNIQSLTGHGPALVDLA